MTVPVPLIMLVIDVLLVFGLSVAYIRQRRSDRRLRTKHRHWIVALIVMVLIEIAGHVEMLL